MSAIIMPAPKPAFNAWPKVDAGKRPLNTWVLVQYKLAPTATKGGIIIADQYRDDDQYKITTARVAAIGPNCFRDVMTGALMHNAPFFSVGDFVRCPLAGGDQFEVESPHGMVRFGFWKDEHLKSIDTAEAEEYEKKWAPEP
jgi:co-chaperonin GroES (HSP10)